MRLAPSDQSLAFLSPAGRTGQNLFWALIAVHAAVLFGLLALYGLLQRSGFAAYAQFAAAGGGAFLIFSFSSLLVRRAQDAGLDAGWVLVGIVLAGAAALLLPQGDGVRVAVTLALVAGCLVGNLPRKPDPEAEPQARGFALSALDPEPAPKPAGRPAFAAVLTPLTVSLCAASVFVLWNGAPASRAAAPAPAAPLALSLQPAGPGLLTPAAADPAAARAELAERERARIAAGGGDAALLKYSQNCFLKLAGSATAATDAEYCVRFDQAVQAAGGETPAFAYFDAATMRARHLRALGAALGSPAAGEQRLAQLSAASAG